MSESVGAKISLTLPAPDDANVKINAVKTVALLYR